MVRTSSALALPALSLILLSACTTPYPNGSPIYGARVDANRAPRGSAEFCETYARQTAGNAYEGGSDADDSIGADLIEAQRAREAGRRAYQRCLAGRTG